MMRRGRTRKKPPVKTPYFSFDGGLNLVDPPLATPDGMLLGVSNYELLVRGGYRRMDGIERFDGQASPSDATYWTLDFEYAVNLIQIGAIVHGGDSGAKGSVLIDPVVDGITSNLILSPESFNSSPPWATSSCNVTADSDTAPDGTLSADTLIDSSGGVVGYKAQTISVDPSWPTPFIGSVFIKKDNISSRYPAFRLNAYPFTNDTATICVNTRTGAFDFHATPAVAATSDAGVEDFGDYWRVWVYLKGAGADTYIQAYLYPAWNNLLDASTSNTSLVGASIVAWGANMVLGDVLPPYSPDFYYSGYFVLGDVVGVFTDEEALHITGAGDEFNYEFSGEFA